MFFSHPHPHKSSKRAPFSFARPLSLEHCLPPFIFIPYALRQHSLNSAGVQNSVIICLFKKFCFNFLFNCHVPVPFKSLHLSLFKYMLICFLLFYNCAGILVGRFFKIESSCFLHLFILKKNKQTNKQTFRFSAKYSTLQCSIFVGLP